MAFHSFAHQLVSVSRSENLAVFPEFADYAGAKAGPSTARKALRLTLAPGHTILHRFQHQAIAKVVQKHPGRLHPQRGATQKSAQGRLFDARIGRDAILGQLSPLNFVSQQVSHVGRSDAPCHAAS